jgi:hypothetical protein
MLIIQIILFCLIIALVIWAIYRYGYNTIYFLPLFLIVFDVLSGWFVMGSGFGNLRNMILFLFMLYLIVRNKGILALNQPLTLYLAFTLFLIPMSSEPRNSVINYVIIWNTLFSFSIGFYFFKNVNQLRELNRFSIVLMFVFLGNALITSSLGIGRNIYGGSLTLGGFLHARLYSASIFLLLLPVIIPLIKSRTYRTIVFICSAALYIILVLSMRRTSFLIPIVGYLVYFIFSKNKNRLIISGLVVITIIVGSYPLYKDMLIEQFSARRNTMEANLTDEYRYKEIVIVWNETFSNPKTAMVGEELFNSAGNYNNGQWGPRVLHTDFANVLHGSGVIGTLLYTCIFFSIAFSFLRFYRTNYRNDFLNELSAVFIALFVTAIFISVQGGMLTPTFRIMIFIYLGAILGILKSHLASGSDENKELSIPEKI